MPKACAQLINVRRLSDGPFASLASNELYRFVPEVRSIPIRSTNGPFRSRLRLAFVHTKRSYGPMKRCFVYWSTIASSFCAVRPAVAASFASAASCRSLLTTLVSRFTTSASLENNRLSDSDIFVGRYRSVPNLIRSIIR